MSSYIPSLAASTGTRIDSAAKHNMACKVDTNLMKAWMDKAGGDLDKRLHTERMRYAVQKDELVMNVSHRMFMSSTYNAYPAIVSNLSDMDDKIKKLLYMLYSAPSPTGFRRLISIYNRWKDGVDIEYGDALYRDSREAIEVLKSLDDKIEIANLLPHAVQIGNLPYFHAQGYALGTGYASSVSGDTVCTVMIGGMQTVMNGAFTCHAGDMVQWYFTGEEAVFMHGNDSIHEDGERIHGQVNAPHSRKRARDYHDKYAFGSENITNRHKSCAVFRIKPYRMYKNPDDDEYKDHYGDKIRVFAKCIGGARPYEMMDIMLMTQSL
jgi:hypothetical protein